VVTGGADGDGYLIEITDRGFGMSSREQAWANHRLASGGGDPGDQAAADRLGLLVVARLARRNGFRVRLRRSGAGGVTAAVRLPAAQLSTRARRRYGRADSPPTSVPVLRSTATGDRSD
jgi:hypothetical protein